jgi:transcriptional regulator with XRE-family HTH domain
MPKPGRSAKVILTPEARVLRRLRNKQGLSMKAAGAKLGYSDSYVSQIENGRENPPTGEKLMKFLSLYGNITEKYFKQLCKDWEDEKSDFEVLVELAEKLPSEKLKTLLVLAQQMAQGTL